MWPRLVVGGVAAWAFSASAALLPGPAEAVECWRGWGYWIDARTRAYKSGELLLVTKGPAVWRPGHAVELYVLDRTTGRIARDVPPITLIPANPRTYYRGRSNYVDGSG
ncbi:MAG: hypothetical protein ACE5JZ_13465, partial [Kiloniellales bacterium]